MTDTATLELARTAFRQQAWKESCARFAEADDEGNLGPSDLESYAQVTALLGSDDSCVALLNRAFHLYLDGSEDEQASECAFWLAFNLMNHDQMVLAGGWLGRAGQLVESGHEESPLHGLLTIPTALQALMQGDAATALELFSRAEQVGRSSGHAELIAMSGLGVGQAQIALGECSAGLAKLDEVMVSVISDDLSPIVAGLVYCAVIIACHEVFDVRRAAEWTEALSQWCARQNDLVPFRGECEVHRAQILVLNGEWDEAAEQINNACRRFADPPGQPAVGMAYYEAGNLHRLRGEFLAAENCYRRANDSGHETQPGVALLRLAQGRTEAAESGIRRALDETAQRGRRPRLLAALVEIALATGNAVEARAASEELSSSEEPGESGLLMGMSRQAIGEVLLAESQPRLALDELRVASTCWRDLDAPYQVARTRVLQGRCCRELGDLDAADMEFDASARQFVELGALPDVAALQRLRDHGSATASLGLTPREIEVIRAVSTGGTNRAIAVQLSLSEKTVARHLNNIFSKLDISSRSAATAFAFQHGLV